MSPAGWERLTRLERAALVCVALALVLPLALFHAIRPLDPVLATKIHELAAINGGEQFKKYVLTVLLLREGPPGETRAIGLSDPWGQPVLMRALSPGPDGKARLKRYSLGPNGVDEQGEGDDISWPLNRPVIPTLLVAYSRGLLLLLALQLAWLGLWARRPRQAFGLELMNCCVIAAFPAAITLLVVTWASERWWSAELAVWAPPLLPLPFAVVATTGLVGLLLAVMVRRAAPAPETPSSSEQAER